MASIEDPAEPDAYRLAPLDLPVVRVLVIDTTRWYNLKGGNVPRPCGG